MSNYILSILGIVILGIIIDVIIPSGNINKYIKSIYAIFIVAVIVSPFVNYLKKDKDFNIHYQEYEISENLLNFIYKNRISSLEDEIELKLNSEGYSGINIIINFSSENNELSYNSCTINLENLVISTDKQHINSYEFITEVVRSYTGLEDEEILINE